MQSKVVAFPVVNALDENQKLALALDEIKNHHSDSREQNVLRKSVQLILDYEQLSQTYEKLGQQFEELRYESDLELTLIEDKLEWIVENLCRFQQLDLDNFASVKLAMEALITNYQSGERTLNEVSRIIEPYQSSPNAPLTDTIRKLIIELKTEKYHIDDLTHDGITGQSDIFRLTNDLLHAKVKIKRIQTEKQELAGLLHTEKTKHVAEVERSRRFWHYYRSKKNSLIIQREIRSSLDKQLEEERTQGKILLEKLIHAEKNNQGLDLQIKDIKNESGIQESKLAMKSEYATTIAGEKRVLMAQVEPVKAKLSRRTKMLQRITMLLASAIAVIVIQNMDVILLARDMALQFFPK